MSNPKKAEPSLSQEQLDDLAAEVAALLMMAARTPRSSGKPISSVIGSGPARRSYKSG